MMIKMISNKTKAIIVGVLILVAYAVLASSLTDSKIIVTTAEVISGLAVIGIAVIMFPFFKQHDKAMTLGYLSFKSIEGGLMIIAGIFFIFTGTAVFATRDPIYMVHTYIFSVSAVWFYLLLLKSKLIPKYISIWGIVSIILLLIANLLEVFSDIILPMPVLILGYTPIIINEVFLAIYLMVKGFTLNKTS